MNVQTSAKKTWNQFPLRWFFRSSNTLLHGSRTVVRGSTPCTTIFATVLLGDSSSVFYLHSVARCHLQPRPTMLVLALGIASCFALAAALRLSMHDVVPIAPSDKLRTWITKSLQAGSAAVIASTLLPKSSQATVYFDLDVYGDKELKIATVNKMKQKLRNAILEDVTVAPLLLQLAITDALSYNAMTQEGGPDGSIQFEVKADSPNAGLERGLEVLLKVKKELQRTNTVSFADICAFGGAEALESAGCARLIVQVGRADAKAAEKFVPTVIDWKNPSANTIQEAFTTSGLDSRDIAAMLGALGELRRVVAETLAAKQAEEEDEDDADFEPQPFVPTTFGTRDAMFGAKMGKGDFGSKYFAAILKGKSDDISSILLDDPKLKALVQKYAANEAAFIQDVQQVYLKMTLLGQASTTRNA